MTPAQPHFSGETLNSAVGRILAKEAEFTEFVIDNGLGPLWHQALHSHGAVEGLSSASLDALRESRFAAAATYSLQREVLRQIDRAFEARDIAYVVIKGVHLRELAYDDPSLRPAGDVDILVSAGQRVPAAAALVDAGFRYRPQPDTISHEASFVKPGIEIDLHWNILRPGRTRFEVTDAFIAGRRRVGGFWAVGDTEAIFLMLAQPPFVRYVCSPTSNLCQAADFIRWTETRPVDWDAVTALLQATGLNTAAWIMLRWFALLGLETPAAFEAKVRPGALRRRYLSYWLERDLPTRWFERLSLLIQLGMTLFLHDRPADAGRALLGWSRAYLGRRQDPFASLPSGPP